MKLGDGVFVLGLWLWMMASVGPQWVGYTLLGVGFVGNVAHEWFLAKKRWAKTANPVPNKHFGDPR